MIISQIYKRTHHSSSYVHTFLHTLIVVGITCCAILMIIGQSLPMAFGLLGALSIIRFRTAIKDSRDTAYLLLVITVSMAVANSLYIIAACITVLLGSLLFILHRVNYGRSNSMQKIFKIHLPVDQRISDLNPIFKKHSKHWNLIESSRNNDQLSCECVFLVDLNNKDSDHKLIEELSLINGHRPVYLYSSTQTPVF